MAVGDDLEQAWVKRHALATMVNVERTMCWFGLGMFKKILRFRLFVVRKNLAKLFLGRTGLHDIRQ